MAALRWLVKSNGERVLQYRARQRTPSGPIGFWQDVPTAHEDPEMAKYHESTYPLWKSHPQTTKIPLSVMENALKQAGVYSTSDSTTQGCLIGDKGKPVAGDRDTEQKPPTIKAKGWYITLNSARLDANGHRHDKCVGRWTIPFPGVPEFTIEDEDGSLLCVIVKE